jgi:hypothetical protein
MQFVPPQSQQYHRYPGQFVQYPQAAAGQTPPQFLNQQQVNQPAQPKKRKKKKKNANTAAQGQVGMVASAAGQMMMPQQFVPPFVGQGQRSRLLRLL